MLRRQRPSGGRHPPPLAPTVSNFKPRAQWNNSGSSIILYVNLPGFYRDQIEIKKDEKTRAIYIQGQRPLSTQTKARFNEVYRVPESFDMTKLNTSFSHGLLTIEFPAVLEGDDKTEKVGNDQGKTVQRTDNEKNRGSSLNGSSLGPKKPLDKEKQVGKSQGKKAVTMASKEEPKTYKSVVEGKSAVPAAEQKVASPSSGRKEHSKQETVVEKKEAVKIGQQKTIGGSLKAKVLENEEKAIKGKKDGDIGKIKAGEKVKEEGSTRTPTIGASLEPKVHFKEEKVERKGDGEIGQSLKEKGKIGSGENKEKMVERITQDVNGNVVSKHDKKDEKMVGYKASEGAIQERVEEAGLVKETRDPKGKPEVMEPRRVDSDVKDLTKGGEDIEKMDTPATTEVRGQEEEGSHIYDTSLVNVGVASLVIMGFGAYVFVPLVKMFY